MPRKRGGQPSNTNALKHGFYSRLFRQIELDDLERLSSDLSSEVAALRVQARRLQELIDFDSLDTETGISILNCLGAAFTRVATLMRTNMILSGQRTEFDAIVDEALEIFHKKRLASNPPPDAEINAT